VAAEKAGAAGDEDTQLLAAPLQTLVYVDELVEEMVDKGPTRRSISTLAFRSRGGASAAHQLSRRRGFC